MAIESSSAPSTRSPSATPAIGGDDAAQLLASAQGGRPYGPDTQLLVIGVHGTNNGPQNVREVTERIGSTLSNHRNVGKAIIDTSFDWSDLSPTQNNTQWREVASGRLTAHTLSTLDDAYASGRLDRNKPVVIMYTGFSHGGNVALLASDETALGLRQRGIGNAAIHNVTLSTPAYTWGEENPAFAARGAQANGVQFAHTHFSIAGDGVIRAAIGRGNYPGPGHADPNKREGVTTNFNMRGVGWNGVDNHGAPQDSSPHMDVITRLVEQRFRGLAPPPQRRAQGDDGVDIAHAIADPALRARYGTLLEGVNALGTGKTSAPASDTASALLDATVRGRFDAGKPVSVVAGLHENTVFAVQGEGPAARRVRVDTAAIEVDSGLRVVAALPTNATAATVDAAQQDGQRNRAV